MLNVRTLGRSFKINAVEIPDPNPEMPLQDAVTALTLNYPILRHTRVLDSDGTLNVAGDTMVFNVVTPPVKTNG